MGFCLSDPLLPHPFRHPASPPTPPPFAFL
jgi:hypothetical protein